MRVLLTGISSFTGYWFALKLQEAGHQVTATLRSAFDHYDGLRAQRIDHAKRLGVEFIENCSFGEDLFIDAVTGQDAICHHAADVTDYHSIDFNVHAAVAANTFNARRVFEHGREHGLRCFVATGSVFEAGEGLGEEPLRAFSPYGLSKGLSWHLLDYWAGYAGLNIGKFVIPNPFGPLEEARFCAHLMRTWVKGEAAEIRTPSYVRDNIPVDLLAFAYVSFVEKCMAGGSGLRCNPSGYVESQGRFAERFAKEIGIRLNIETPLMLANQLEFPEPIMRVNSDFRRYGWNEHLFWNDAAHYYQNTYCQA
jgi:nucleoside-diphosphate-sugar epimerase